MPANAGDINVRLTMDTSQYNKKSKQVEGNTKKMSKGFGKAGTAIGIAIVAVVATMKKLVSVTKESVKAFIVQEKAEAQLNAVLKSTGSVSGMTAKSVKDLADKLSMVSTFGDEAIIASSSLLLTFTKIGKDTFPRAQQSVLDLATAMKTDLKSASIQLGKALNDPVLGMTAMSRSGITFSQSQKDLVKAMMETNDIAGAQNVILSEMETQFSGAALAAAETFGGQMEIIGNQVGDVKETFGSLIAEIGEKLLPFVLQAVIDFKELAATFKDNASFKEFIRQIDLLSRQATKHLPTILKTFKMIAMAIKEIALDQLIITFQTFSTLFDGMDLSTMDMIIGNLVLVAIYLKVLGAVVSTVTTFTVSSLTLIAQTLKDIGLVASDLPGEIKVVFIAIKNYIINSFANATDTVIDFFAGVFSTAGNFMKNLGKLMTGQMTIGEVFGEAFNNIKTVSAQTAAEMVKDIAETNKKFKNGLFTSQAVKDVYLRLKTLATNAKSGVEALGTDIAQIWKKTGGDIKDIFITMAQNKKEANAELLKFDKEHADETLTAAEERERERLRLLADFSTVELDILKKKWDAIKQQRKDDLEAAKKLQDEYIQLASDSSQEALGLASGVMSGIGDIYSNILDGQTQDIEANYTAEQTALQDKLDRGILSQEQYDTQSEQLEKEKAKNLYAIQKKQFDVQKGLSIAQVWVDAASAIVATWAGYASMPIVGQVLAGIQTAAILTMAGVQTGVIASQQPPSPPAFALGGTVGNTTIRMNENGGEIASMPDGTLIVPHDISRMIARDSGKTNNINISFAGANIDSRMSLDKIANSIMKKLGRKLALS